MKYTNTLLFFLYLSACTIGPDYKSPDLNLPNEFQTIKDNKTPLFANKRVIEQKRLWWDNFLDKKMVELIISATTDNLSIQASLARIDKAESSTLIAFSGLFPQMTLDADYIKNKTAGARFPGVASNGIEYEIYTVGGSASWEIDIFGRVRRSIEAAESIENNVFFNSVDLINSIQAQIATAYIQLRGAQNQKRIAEENAKLQNDTLEILAHKFKTGMIGAIDFERSKSQYLKTKSTILDYEILVNNSINRISALTGKYPNEIKDKGELEKVADIPNYSGQLQIIEPFELINRRPDLRAAEQLAKSASAEIGVAMGDLFPKVNFIGRLSREARNISDLSSPTANAFNYGPNISWSILNLNAILSNIDSAKSEAKINLLEYRNKVVLALEEVENSFASLNNLTEKVTLLRESSESSISAQNIAKVKYEAGSISLLDLLIAQGDTLLTQSAYIQAQTELSLAYINLFRAFGGAWEENNLT